jgi:hypothetical protein
MGKVRRHVQIMPESEHLWVEKCWFLQETSDSLLGGGLADRGLGHFCGNPRLSFLRI